jgi:O-antigen ligase
LGYFVSDESDKVLTNVVHLGFGAASALLFSIGQLGKSTSLRNTYVVVLIPIFLIQAASIYLLISVDTGVVDFLADGKRYSGYAGNPNTLGGLCALGIWSAMSLMYESSSKHSFFLVILVALFAAGLVVTASTTATVVSIIVASILLWGMVLRRCTGLTRVIFNLLIVLVSVISALLFVVYIGDNYIELFTESVGREGTLSGRTELWSIAREAITEKPILGWSYDSHQSVFGFKLYAVPFNHYHNGYMDTLIAGGFVLGAFVIIHFIQFIRLYLSVSKVNKAVLPLLLPLVIILISNFTEYSLLRNNNPLWTTYMVAYFLLVTVFVRRDGAVPVVQPRQRRVLKKSRKQHFRF